MEQGFEEGARACLKAVADHIVPGEQEWPSAWEAGALTALERHAASHPEVWQSLIMPGLNALDADSILRYGRAFAALTEDEQNGLLAAIRAGEDQQHWPIPSAAWLDKLATILIEGYYGSPGQGGNQNGASWRMIGYRPGPASVETVRPPETDLPLTDWASLSDRYDAVIIGAGAGGSVAAAELAEAGMRVLVVERGSWLTYEQIARDHLRNHRLSHYGHNTGPSPTGHPRTFLGPDGIERVTAPHEGDYHNNAMTVGGGTRVYGAQAWRFHPDDFRMASRYGIPDGSSLADWPIGYDELAPYYDRAEWEVGVCGDGDAHPGRGSRARPYPMPPLSRTREAERLAVGAAKLGWEVGAVPLLINSVPRHDRAACVRCGECIGFACPTDAKNGGHNTMLARALATGNCELICDTLAERIETEGGRRATGVRLISDVGGAVSRRLIQATHVIVAAGAIESSRLLLHSASDAEPHGIGNRSGQVGRHLQGHVYAGAFGLFDEPVQDGLGPGVSVATFRHEHRRDSGILGGGLLANEFTRTPLIHWYRALAPDAPRWGLAGKAAMRDSYLRTGQIQGPIQEIPAPDARVRLSPTVKDRFGMPVAMLSGQVHRESLRAAINHGEQAERWLWAAGASRVWRTRPGGGLSGGQHQAGTLRMGDDPASSVTDPTGRVHGYDNLWICDGSVHVTNGGVNPVLTIMALVFRTAGQVVRAR